MVFVLKKVVIQVYVEKEHLILGLKLMMHKLQKSKPKNARNIYVLFLQKKDTKHIY